MFYLTAIFTALYNLLLYAFFRSGIYDHLRLSKMSKTYIRKNRKGLKNYWLYSEIHRQHPLGALYYLNIIFLTVTLCFTLLTLLLGYIKALQPVILVCAAVVCLVEIPCVMFASVSNCRTECGRPFVLWAKRKYSQGYFSSLFDMLSWVLTALLVFSCYTCI